MRRWTTSRPKVRHGPACLRDSSVNPRRGDEARLHFGRQRRPKRAKSESDGALLCTPMLLSRDSNGADIRNAPGRCVSTSSGDPTFSSPTTAAMRASVSSSFSGSGASGMNNPFCVVRGFAGSAAR